MKIGVDLDCVLNNLNEEWLKIYNEKYDDSLTISDIKSWNMAEHVKPECGTRIYELLHTPGLFGRLDPQPHSREVIDTLVEKHDVYVVTATDPLHIVAKFNWIKRHFPMISEKNIITIQNKGLLNLDVLIDDGGHNIETFKGTGVVYSYPWNEYLGEKYVRVNSWLEIGEYFFKLEKEQRTGCLVAK